MRPINVVPSNRSRYKYHGPNREQVQTTFYMTGISQGKGITVRRRCSSCSSCYETMRLRKQCSPRNVLPSQSRATSSLQMSIFARKIMKDIDGKVVRPGAEEGRAHGFTKFRPAVLETRICWEGKRVWLVMPHGKRPDVNALPPLHHLFRAALEAALFVLCNIQVALQTVSLSRKTQFKGQPLTRPGRATAEDQRGCCAPVFRRGVAKRKCSTCQVSEFCRLE
jgi:hypothetical protein